MLRIRALDRMIPHRSLRRPEDRPSSFQLPGTHPSSRLSDELRKHRVYPLYHYPLTPLERLMVKTGFGGVGRCFVCGAISPWKVTIDNLRETGFCRRCNSMNRYRQLAYLVCKSLSLELGRRLSSLKDVAALENLVIHNTDANSPIHRALAGMKNYLCSEYFGESHASGAMVNGVMHQDLMNLSLPDESVDIVLSADVFEHIPDPYQAHREVFRILKAGGRHIFTVPFDQAQYLDDVRAVIAPDGSQRHLKPPVYHSDPIRPDEGCLVYTFFAIEMLARLRRLGYRTHLYRLHDLRHGFFGCNGLVFEAIKHDPPSEWQSSSLSGTHFLNPAQDLPADVRGS